MHFLNQHLSLYFITMVQQPVGNVQEVRTTEKYEEIQSASSCSDSVRENKCGGRYQEPLNARCPHLWYEGLHM